MKKDYYTIDQKRRYYHWRSINPRIDDRERKKARIKYEKFNKASPLFYEPKYIPQKKGSMVTLKSFIQMLLNKKHRLDYISDKRPDLVKKRHVTMDKEIKRLKYFRHKYRVAYEEPIQIKENDCPRAYV